MKSANFALATLDREAISNRSVGTLAMARLAAKLEARARNAAILLVWGGWNRGPEYVEPSGRFSKFYNHNGLSGCVNQWTARDTKTLIGLYHGVQAGMEVVQDALWCVVCEVHHTLVGHASLVEARRTRSPRDFCDECRDNEDRERE
jgi:hypothetical protein